MAWLAAPIARNTRPQIRMVCRVMPFGWFFDKLLMDTLLWVWNFGSFKKPIFFETSVF
jgi:hypothetical protein